MSIQFVAYEIAANGYDVAEYFRFMSIKTTSLLSTDFRT